jgi:hypothetical protein
MLFSLLGRILILLTYYNNAIFKRGGSLVSLVAVVLYFVQLA